MKSWKIGAVVGLIAGIIAGIVAYVSNTVANVIGLPDQDLSVATANIPEIYILMNVVWGIIFGIIFAIAYDLIPSKYISKGFFYGIVVFLITNLRDSSYYWPYVLVFDYTLVILSMLFIGFFQSITYGTILAFLYKSLLNRYNVPKVRRKIETYELMGGIRTGAIAGLLGGVFALFSRMLGEALGLFPYLWIAKEGKYLVIIFEDFFSKLVAGFAVQLFINMIWGIVFGMIFTKVYNLVARARWSRYKKRHFIWNDIFLSCKSKDVSLFVPMGQYPLWLGIPFHWIFQFIILWTFPWNSL